MKLTCFEVDFSPFVADLLSLKQELQTSIYHASPERPVTTIKVLCNLR
jgi:hypothetical protein